MRTVGRRHIIFYMATHPAEITTWTDRRRYWWLASVFMPMLPLAGIVAWRAGGGEAWLWLTPVVLYGVVPLLDYLLGEDEDNPPEALVPELETDRWYRWLTWLVVPAVWLTVVVAVSDVLLPPVASVMEPPSLVMSPLLMT